MPQSYSPSNIYNGIYTLPSDGDPAVAESVNITLRALANTNLYNATNVSHQMMDDRGKTSNLAGAIVINDAGGSIRFLVPFRMDGDVDIYNDVFIHSGNPFGCDGPGTFVHDLNVGTNSTDTLQVNATLNVSAPAAFHGDTSFTGGDLDIHDDTTITADLTVNGSVQLGSDPGSQTVGVGAPLVVSELARFLSDVNINGNANIGNNSTDSHQIRGTVECTGDVSVDGTFESNTETNLREVNVSGQFTANGDANFRQDVVLGETASDTLTINAQIDAPVTFTDAGRIVQESGVINGIDATLSVTSPREIRVVNKAGTATQTILIDDTGASDGDKFVLYLNRTSPSAPTLVQTNVSAGTLTISTGTFWVITCVRFAGYGWDMFACQAS